MKRSLLIALVVLTALGLVVAGCGSSKKSSSSSAGTTTPPATTTPSSGGGGGGGGGGAGGLKLSADPSGALKFSTSTLSATAGKVTITMSNPASLQHGIALTGSGVNKTGSIVGSGGTSTVTATLKPGTYTFYCPVPGHRQAGMQGTLTVK